MELAKLKRENEVLLQIIGQLTAAEKLGKKMRYGTVVKQLTPPESKTELAKQLGVSRSAFYYQPKLPTKDLSLKVEIEKVMATDKAYGHKRIDIHLKINKKRILRVMKLFGLKRKR